jgi:hypothetical protein
VAFSAGAFVATGVVVSALSVPLDLQATIRPMDALMSTTTLTNVFMELVPFFFP